MTFSKFGRLIMGVKTPIIRPGDDLKKIVFDSVMTATGSEIADNAAIGVTESVLAISQMNFATKEELQEDVADKFEGADAITIFNPIQSRNRFINILKAIAEMKQFRRVFVAFSYPADEVGNHLVPDNMMYGSDINPYKDCFHSTEWIKKFGEPKHPCTGQNYIKLYEDVAPGKVEVFLCNSIEEAAKFCNNVLVCTIREERRKYEVEQFRKLNKTAFDLTDILNHPVNGTSGYSPYGLLGSNMQANGSLKLAPRDGQKFCEDVQKMFKERIGKHVEVIVFGDGAYKDPISGIWELADPSTHFGATEGFNQMPNEVKLKYLASQYPNASQEELQALVAKMKAEQKSDDKEAEARLGTTPRMRGDLFASWADLTTGSGDQGTPVVYAVNFF